MAPTVKQVQNALASLRHVDSTATGTAAVGTGKAIAGRLAEQVESVGIKQKGAEALDGTKSGTVGTTKPALTPESKGLASKRPGLHLKIPSSKPNELLARLGTVERPGGLFAELRAQVGSREDGSPYLNDVPDARFSDVPTAAATQVFSPAGKPLPANRVNVCGKNVAIASQYPTLENLESYCRMLADNRTPVLVILASDNEIDAMKMPRYFSENGKYGNVTVDVAPPENRRLAGDLEVRAYTMRVGDSASGKVIPIPVLHVPNWPDRTGQGASTLDALAEHIASVMVDRIDTYRSYGSRAVNDPDKLLPVIHCRAGVGRTGQVIAALALQEDGTASLEKIISDMRKSRNHLMVQTEGQLRDLVELAESKKRDILRPEQAPNAADK